MTVALRPAEDRGHADHGWLDTFHSFSFAHYYDPQHMGFRALRVINDDTVRPGTGFATHGHRDMEIISYVVKGALAHEDSTGSKSVIRRGEVQWMSAGTGVRHSEYNASRQEDVRFLQIWILPERAGLPPAYAQQSVPKSLKLNALALIAAPDGPLPIRQDVRVYASLLDAGAAVTHRPAPGRGAWVQMVSGRATVNGIEVKAGDGLAVEDVTEMAIAATDSAELLLFDLA